MSISEKLVEISEYNGIGYQPLVDYDAWRVAILRYHPELLPENIDNMQRHDETDEVFVLLAGRCTLFFGEGSDAITNILAEDMQPLKLYNVKRGTWHTHTLSEDAMVLIVENVDTRDANSPKVKLTPEQREVIMQLARSVQVS